MHMSDALISPAVGGVMWAAAAAATAYSVKKLGKEEQKAPLMGVMGAFVFAAQMINFTIPGTGSSGHISGAMLLSALLGPRAAFIVMSVVLAIQALFFADGGLLALGSNIFNIAFFACFIAYPLIYMPLSKRSAALAALAACVISLQLGAFGVVLETQLSGISALPMGTFLLFMQPIHLAIGIGEGLITAALLVFLRRAAPGTLPEANVPQAAAGRPLMKRVIVIFAALTIVVGGALSLFASSYPDGLEWSVQNVAGSPELEASGSVHEAFSSAQEATAILPDYGFRQDAGDAAVSVGTSVSGLVGSALVLAAALGCGALIFFVKRRKKSGAA